MLTHQYIQSLELLADGEDDMEVTYASNNSNSRGQTPGANPTSIVLPPPIRISEVSAAQQKKMRDKEYQRKKRANAARERSLLASNTDDEMPSARRTTKKRSGDDD